MDKARWVGGLAYWEIDDTLYLSVAFTWELDRAFSMAMFARALGKRVIAGGPALFLVKMQHRLTEVAEIGTDYTAPRDQGQEIKMYALINTMPTVDCYVGRAISLHKSIEAAEKADEKLQRLTKRNNGQQSYLPTVIREVIATVKKGQMVELADVVNANV